MCSNKKSVEENRIVIGLLESACVKHCQFLCNVGRSIQFPVSVDNQFLVSDHQGNDELNQRKFMHPPFSLF